MPSHVDEFPARQLVTNAASAVADDGANAHVDAAAAAAVAAVAAHAIARAFGIVAPVVVPLDEHARVDEYLAAVAPTDAVVERHMLAPVSKTRPLYMAARRAPTGTRAGRDCAPTRCVRAWIHTQGFLRG